MATVKINPILQSLIPEFLDNRKTDVVEMNKALEHSDFEAIRVTGHNLRGCGTGYGFVPITDIGTVIEQAATEQDAMAIKKAIMELSDYLDNVEPVYE